ncbi:MAG: class I SAM-dependent methyltransferase [Deltaproteobacteria bacterium]|nr:class I SAM-dependent methyltransferase [Deltaproteobacteria bacterium]
MEPSPKSSVAGYFSRLASTYGEGAFYARRRASAIQAIASELAAACQILDLGCGNGAFRPEIRRLNQQAEIIGADISFAMAIEARHRGGGSALVVQADAIALPFASATWDVVLCSRSLQIVSDLEKCLSEIARCLKGGGRLIAFLEGSGLAAALKEVMTADEWVDFVRVTGSQLSRTNLAEYFRLAFERAGLEFEGRCASFTVRWPDIQELVRVRWLPLVSEAARVEAERIMVALGAKQKLASLNLTLTEQILLGQKPD